MEKSTAQDTKKDAEWLSIVDPACNIVVLGIPFRAEEGESPETFARRWKDYLRVVHDVLDPGLSPDYDKLTPREQQEAEGRRKNAIAYGLTVLQIENVLYKEARVPMKGEEGDAGKYPERGSISYRDFLSPPEPAEPQGPRCVRSTIRQGCDYIEREFDDGTVVRENREGVVIERFTKGAEQEGTTAAVRDDLKRVPYEAVETSGPATPPTSTTPAAGVAAGSGSGAADAAATGAARSDLESRVGDLQGQVDELRRRLEGNDLQGAAPLQGTKESEGARESEASGSYTPQELAGIYTQLEDLKKQVSSGTVAPTTPADLERMAERLGNGLGTQFGQTLQQGLRSLVSEIMQGLRSVQRDAIASGLGGGAQYQGSPMSPQQGMQGSSESGAGAQGGAGAAAEPSRAASDAAPGDYAAMSYEEVRRTVHGSLKSEKARMILQSAINNCGNERGERALRQLIGKFPGQEAALREYIKKHRKRIGV